MLRRFGSAVVKPANDIGGQKMGNKKPAPVSQTKGWFYVRRLEGAP
jgi:hypothetical protein